MVAVFWGIALYGEVLLKYGGHIVAVLGLSLGMFVRRYKKGTQPVDESILTHIGN